MIKKYREGNYIVSSIFGIKIKKYRPYIPKGNGASLKSILRINVITNTHKKTFANFKNSNNGKDLFVIGAGPTLKYFTNTTQNAKSIALNRSFLFDKIKFDYLFANDKAGIVDYYDELINYKGNNCIKFLGDLPVGKEWQIPEQIRIKANARKFCTTASLCESFFALDIENEPLGHYRSIALPALQFALYTNPSRIFLVGIDCTSSGHFTGKDVNVTDRGSDNNENVRLLIKNAYPDFKKFAETFYPDTEIISVNPVGLQGFFKDVYTKEYLKDHPDFENMEVELFD